VYSVVTATVNGLFRSLLPYSAGDFDNNHHSHLGTVRAQALLARCRSRWHHSLDTAAETALRNSMPKNFHSFDFTHLRLLQRRAWRAVLGVALALSLPAAHAVAATILFIGNSFTIAHGSPVSSYRPDTVTDLNRQGIGAYRRCSNHSPSRAGSTTTCTWKRARGEPRLATSTTN